MRRYAHQHDVRIPTGFNPDSPFFGPHARVLIARCKAKMGLKPVDGHFTWPLELRLRPYVDPPPVPAWRLKAKRIMHDAILDEPLWHYLQARPYVLAWARGRSIRIDCSGGCSMIARMAGQENPSGASVPWGYGNTATMLMHLSSRRLRRAADLHVGDFVLWNGHVCTVYQRGVDPVLWSHGQEPGPILIYLSVEDRYHAGSPIFLPARAR